MATTKFEKNKCESVKFLSTAALDTSVIEPSQAHGVFLLASHLRAELYENGERATVDAKIIEEFDKAIKRLFK